MVKAIRFISLIVLLSFAFIMEHEVFHMQLENSFYSFYQAMSFSITESQFPEFIHDISYESDNNDCSLFIITIEKENRLKQSITIYSCSSELISSLKRHHITEGIYTSLFNGTSTIKIRLLSEMIFPKATVYNGLLLSTGGSGVNQTIYTHLKNSYNLSFPQKYQSDEKDMIIIIWLLAAIAILIIYTSDIINYKKKIAISALYGEDILKKVFTRSIYTFFSLNLMFIISKLIVQSFENGEYLPEIALFIFESTCLICSLLYFCLLNINFKQTILNGNNDNSYLKYLKIVKSITFIIILIALSGNINNLKRSLPGTTKGSTFESFNNPNYIYIKDNEQALTDSTKLQKIWKSLYTYNCNTIRPVISIKVAHDSHDYMIVNNYARSLAPSIINENSTNNNNIYIYYKDKKTLNKELVDSIIKFYCTTPNCKVNFTEYHNNSVATYVDTLGISGYGVSKNPVIIYFPSTSLIITEKISNHQDIFYDTSKVAFLRLLSKQFPDINSIETEITDLNDYIAYKENLYIKLIEFLSSLCALLIILDIIITITILGITYKVNALEYALKTTLGNNILVKNQAQITSFIPTSLIPGIIICIIGNFTNLYTTTGALFSFLILITIELFVCLVYIIKSEKFPISKTLKGGCL